jgi:hypothetical protein
MKTLSAPAHPKNVGSRIGLGSQKGILPSRRRVAMIFS